MSPTTTLSIVYGLITLGSASVLYLSFKNGIDTSGKYFLLAESLVLVLLSLLLIAGFNANFEHPLIFFAGNLAHIGSEIAVLFSVYALNHQIKIKKFILVMMIAAAYCVLIEYFRFNVDAKLPLLLFPIASFAVAISTFAIYKTAKGADLGSNIFYKVIGYLEIGLACFAVLRIASYLLGIYVSPRNPSTSSVLLFALLIAFNVFRYIAYQSLRISWVDHRASDDNPLNRNIMRVVREKNEFLQGLISSNRVLGISALANSLAHQFSQPITGIILKTEAVKRDLTEAGLHHKYIDALDKVTEQLEKLSRLLDGLRRLVGPKEHKLEAINLQETCDEVLEIIGPKLQSKQIDLKKHYKNDPYILGNTTQIQQVLINVFNNATDAIDIKNGALREISLTISQEAGCAVVTVEDTGSGISSEILPTMFTLYQSTKKDGLGVGLWLSKEIIHQHQGTIIARKSMLGGAILELQIPLAANENGVS